MLKLVSVARPFRLIVHRVNHVGPSALRQRPQQVAVANVARGQRIAAARHILHHGIQHGGAIAGGTSPIASGIELAHCDPCAYWLRAGIKELLVEGLADVSRQTPHTSRRRRHFPAAGPPWPEPPRPHNRMPWR